MEMRKLKHMKNAVLSSLMVAVALSCELRFQSELGAKIHLRKLRPKTTKTQKSIWLQYYATQCQNSYFRWNLFSQISLSFLFYWQQTTYSSPNLREMELAPTAHMRLEPAISTWRGWGNTNSATKTLASQIWLRTFTFLLNLRRKTKKNRLPLGIYLHHMLRSFLNSKRGIISKTFC